MAGPIWITGAHGFIGGNLSRALVAAGEKVVGFRRAGSLSPTASDDLLSYPLSPKGFTDALAHHGVPRRVYHLAGGSTVGLSFSNPHEDFLSNVATTEALLEALRGRKVHVVFASSAAVYGEGHTKGIQVDERLAPWSPYGYHKVMAEQLLCAHSRAFGLAVTVLRLFSIYGPGLRKQLLFDACSRLAASDPTAPLALDGTGLERRDWLEVGDVIEAMRTIQDPNSGEIRVYNLASGFPLEIRDVAFRLVSAWGGSREVVFSHVVRQGDPFSLVADPGSLPPGFVPSVALPEGISRFVSWFQSGTALNDRARRIE